MSENDLAAETEIFETCDYYDLLIEGDPKRATSKVRLYDWLAAFAGAVVWARLWREYGWVPGARFTGTWSDEKIPNGQSITSGRLLPGLLPGQASRPSGNVSLSKPEIFARDQNALPPDPFTPADVRDHYTVSVKNFRKPYIPYHAFRDTVDEVIFKYVLLVSIPSCEITTTPR